GQAIRATAQNARAARVMGVDTDRVYAWTFALNAAICGASGALVAMTWVVHPYLGLPYTVRSFMIVILAGLGNVAGALFAVRRRDVRLRARPARRGPRLLHRTVRRYRRGRPGGGRARRPARLRDPRPARPLLRHRNPGPGDRGRRAGQRLGFRRRRRRYRPAAVSRRSRRPRDVLLLPVLRPRRRHVRVPALALRGPLRPGPQRHPRRRG